MVERNNNDSNEELLDDLISEEFLTESKRHLDSITRESVKKNLEILQSIGLFKKEDNN